MNTFLKKWKCLQMAMLSFFFLIPYLGKSQCFQNPDGTYVTATGEACVNTIITAVPFLRIVPDARSASMGDAGLATSTDANAIHFNVSKLVFAENKMVFGLTYTPWLKSLAIKDVYLGYAAGYYKLNESNVLSLSFKYFSLGELAFSNANGVPLNIKPHEFEINAAFAKKLSPYLSGGFGLKYIYSNLAAGQMVGGQAIEAGKSLAVDLSMTYQLPNLTIGLALTNFGSRITYTNSVNKDFIPTNLGLGIAWNKSFGNQHLITLTTDINKLMAPTPDPGATDSDNDGVPDYKQVSVLKGTFGSFSDAPGGFSEELRELMFSFGSELWINEQYAFRLGYFHEHATKGNRKYFTTGFGF